MLTRTGRPLSERTRILVVVPTTTTITLSTRRGKSAKDAQSRYAVAFVAWFCFCCNSTSAATYRGEWVVLDRTVRVFVPWMMGQRSHHRHPSHPSSHLGVTPCLAERLSAICLREPQCYQRLHLLFLLLSFGRGTRRVGLPVRPLTLRPTWVGYGAQVVRAIHGVFMQWLRVYHAFSTSRGLVA